jgi:formylglycine-generating enzyme required for sulfatase activity
VTTIGLITLGIGMIVIFSPSLKTLPATLFPTATASHTPTLESTSTQTNKPTFVFTATPEATTRPPVSPTPKLGIGSTWIRPADGMEMVFVPEGEFTMGSDEGAEDEKPAHPVYLDAYWIDNTEVTNAMYARCVANNACKDRASSV